MTATRVLLVGIVTMALACGSSGGNQGGGSAPADAGPDGRASDYVPFTAVTRAIDDDESGAGSIVLVVTDARGPSACALGDEAATPVGAASSVLIKLDTDGGTQCPAGTYALDTRGGRCNDANRGTLGSDCAVYRRWGADGTERARLLATAGAATIRDVPLSAGRSRCTVEIDVQFPGGRVTETFDIDFEGGASLPLCTDVACDPRCQPWQSCDRGACVDVTCIDAGSACPRTGSPACCTDDPYRQLACQEEAALEYTCCVAHGDLCRFDDDCCGTETCQLNRLGTHTCL